MVPAIVIYASRYKKVPPDQAMVVYGHRLPHGRGYQIITGGGKFIIPVIESFEFMPLGLRTVDVMIERLKGELAPTLARLNLHIVVHYHIGSDPETLSTASEHHLHSTDADMDRRMSQIVEGHARTVCARLTVEEVTNERDRVGKLILTGAASDARCQGFEISFLTLKQATEKELRQPELPSQDGDGSSNKGTVCNRLVID